MIRRLLIALALICASWQAQASSNGILTQGLSSSTTGSPGGSTSLSALTSAISSNTFDNAAFPQTWTWNSLSTQTAMGLTSSSLTTGKELDVEVNNTASTGYAGYFSNTSTQTGAYAVYVNGLMGFSNAAQANGAISPLTLVTSGTTYKLKSSDVFVALNDTTTGNKTLTVIPGTYSGQTYIVKDETGTATQYPHPIWSRAVALSIPRPRI